jgi:diaminohydroxyphosphoribosylaminopyrimidine deaminase/5-amino-6-(5-phosphoribosylamino)uracil reductase
MKRWDPHFMSTCLSLAKQAEGRTAPNPMVGAVVVDDAGNIVGSGFHPQAGQPHAEVFALEEAGILAQGATLYVNLEPCNHHGRTPPCTDKIIASGVKRVVIGMKDPNPLVDGTGIQALEAKGIETCIDVIAEECTWLNRAFVKRVKTKLPWVILKLATTLDGRIADRFGKSRWITGPQARQYVHELRNRVDCVLVGKRTVLADDPSLNVREVSRARDPIRAVLDSNLSLPKTSKIFRPDTGGKTYIFCSKAAAAKGVKQEEPKAEASNFSVEYFGIDNDGRSSQLNLRSVLLKLAEQGINTVLCEGGGQLAASLVHHHLIDEIDWIIAPKILGDVDGHPAMAEKRPIHLNQALQLFDIRYTQLDDDMLIHGVIKGAGARNDG